MTDYGDMACPAFLFHALVLRDFVIAALWLKLNTMERLPRWLKEPMLCPICAVRETDVHVLSQCKYLCLAAKVVAQCFDDVMVRQVTYTPVHLLKCAPDVLLGSPLATVLWSARWASWRVRCLVRASRGALLLHAMWSLFFKYWCHMLGQVSAMHGGDFSGYIREFLHALESLDDSGRLKHPRALISLSPPPTKAHVKAQNRRDNKEERLQRQLPLINSFLQQGYTAIYTDGSSKHYDVIGWVGGFGAFVHTERPLSYSHPPPAECHQTNNG